MIAAHQALSSAAFVQGRDHTLFALRPGQVTFSYSKLTKRRTVSVKPLKVLVKNTGPLLRTPMLPAAASAALS